MPGYAVTMWVKEEPIMKIVEDTDDDDRLLAPLAQMSPKLAEFIVKNCFAAPETDLLPDAKKRLQEKKIEYARVGPKPGGSAEITPMFVLTVPYSAQDVAYDAMRTAVNSVIKKRKAAAKAVPPAKVDFCYEDSVSGELHWTFDFTLHKPSSKTYTVDFFGNTIECFEQTSLGDAAAPPGSPAAAPSTDPIDPIGYIKQLAAKTKSFRRQRELKTLLGLDDHGSPVKWPWDDDKSMFWSDLAKARNTIYALGPKEKDPVACLIRGTNLKGLNIHAMRYEFARCIKDDAWSNRETLRKYGQQMAAGVLNAEKTAKSAAKAFKMKLSEFEQKTLWARKAGRNTRLTYAQVARDLLGIGVEFDAERNEPRFTGELCGLPLFQDAVRFTVYKSTKRKLKLAIDFVMPEKIRGKAWKTIGLVYKVGTKPDQHYANVTQFSRFLDVITKFIGVFANTRRMELVRSTIYAGSFQIPEGAPFGVPYAPKYKSYAPVLIDGNDVGLLETGSSTCKVLGLDFEEVQGATFVRGLGMIDMDNLNFNPREECIPEGARVTLGYNRRCNMPDWVKMIEVNEAKPTDDHVDPYFNPAFFTSQWDSLQGAKLGKRVKLRTDATRERPYRIKKEPITCKAVSEDQTKEIGSTTVTFEVDVAYTVKTKHYGRQSTKKNNEYRNFILEVGRKLYNLHNARSFFQAWPTMVYGIDGCSARTTYNAMQLLRKTSIDPPRQWKHMYDPYLNVYTRSSDRKTRINEIAEKADKYRRDMELSAIIPELLKKARDDADGRLVLRFGWDTHAKFACVSDGTIYMFDPWKNPEKSTYCRQIGDIAEQTIYKDDSGTKFTSELISRGADQGFEGSCVLQALSRGLMLADATEKDPKVLAGIPPDDPDDAAPYAIAALRLVNAVMYDDSLEPKSFTSSGQPGVPDPRKAGKQPKMKLTFDDDDDDSL